jgi:hypothetical protein
VLLGRSVFVGIAVGTLVVAGISVSVGPGEAVSVTGTMADDPCSVVVSVGAGSVSVTVGGRTVAEASVVTLGAAVVLTSVIEGTGVALGSVVGATVVCVFGTVGGAPVLLIF